MRRRVVVIEDDATLRQALTYNLAREGYDVTAVADGEAGLQAARGPRVDLIVLDLMLPGMSGTEVLRVLRSEGRRTPVIILSAKADEVDRVVGLKLGADDYVTKPFSRPELLARVEAVLRRPQGVVGSAAVGGPEGRLSFGDLQIDAARREVTVDGEPIHVTAREFDLLAFMAASPERIFTREQLIGGVWGYDYPGAERTVDVHISWLRGKLRARSGHNYFRTARGVGYAFAPPSS